MKTQDIEDMLFISGIMGLAHSISQKDHNRIKQLLSNKNDSKSCLNTHDDITDRIISTLVIMEFVIKQLAIIIPPTEDVVRANNEIINRLPEGTREEIEKFVEKIKESFE